MRATLTLIAVVVCAWCLIGAGSPAVLARGYADSCGVRAAQRHLRAAERAAREARYVVCATRQFSREYGVDVGRWVWLARDVGWARQQLPELMLIIQRESGGSPKAKNPTSTASGLLQFLSFWWQGKWNPFDPRQNLRHGYLAWKSQGFAPWAL